ncbi:MAG: c-type cytochrome biogenesis protein CcmI [Alteromonadaceae bacterium]|nr:MAG: c-type cytochrome biogenesis protein CcmI [Alteromonadaceae bacterium]
MAFWQVFTGFSILAGLFLLWPAILSKKEQKKSLRSNAQSEVNNEVHQQHLDELSRTFDRGEIESSELLALTQDLQDTLNEENAQIEAGYDKPVTSSFKTRIPILILVIALPLSALLLYLYVGAKPDWEIYALNQQRIKAETAEVLAVVDDQLIERLHERLQQRPDNQQAWYLLATVGIESGDYDEAVIAYERLMVMAPETPWLRAEYSKALFFRAGSTITPAVRANTQLALKADPTLSEALGLAGIDAFQSADFRGAVDYWERAIAQLDPHSAAYSALTGGIEQAKTALEARGESLERPVADAGTAAEASKKERAPSISLQVKLRLKGGIEVGDDDTVFVYARAWQGPRMPLAIQRITVAQLPTTVTLDQSMSMAPGMDLASFPQIEIVARISATGSAIPSSGDWQGAYGPFDAATQKDVISLEVNEQLP